MGEANVLIAKTGVKYVHAAAHSFDIGVYFEANGHGTILFGEKFGRFLETCEPKVRSLPAFRRLRLLPSLIHPAVGDALSDLLFVDFILQEKGWDISRWNQLYTDYPSRQSKVVVPDRTYRPILFIIGCMHVCSLRPSDIHLFFLLFYYYYSSKKIPAYICLFSFVCLFVCFSAPPTSLLPNKRFDIPNQ